MTSAQRAEVDHAIAYAGAELRRHLLGLARGLADRALDPIRQVVDTVLAGLADVAGEAQVALHSAAAEVHRTAAAGAAAPSDPPAPSAPEVTQ